MVRRRVVGCAIAMASCGAVGSVAAEPLPLCHVRLVKSAATEAVSRAAEAQVEVWADARDRGCVLVPTIDAADVRLEFSGYKQMSAPDGTPAEEWRFVARRLSEPDKQKGTYRFVYTTLLDKKTRAHIARELPVVLNDVCVGYLPKPTATDGLDR